MDELVNAVYFDTSILRQHSFSSLKQGLARFLKARETYPFDCFVPEAALREWAAHVARVLDERVTAMAAAVKNLRKVDSSLLWEYSAPWGRDSKAYARSLLEKEVLAASLSVVPTPAVDVERLLTMSIDVEAPFDKAGRGFRDAVILETVLNHARGRFSSILLVSADNDFSEQALEAVSVESFTIRRARDLNHALELINEKYLASVRAMNRTAQEEFLAYLRHHREEFLRSLRYELRPSEELLRGNSNESTSSFFWSLQRIDKILDCEFGDFGLGSDLPPLVVLAMRDVPVDRLAVEMTIDAKFNLLVSIPPLYDKARLDLPEQSPPDSQPVRSSKEISVTRKVTFVASFSRDDDGNIHDVHVEAVDGALVADTA
jgi:hypothetical protein